MAMQLAGTTQITASGVVGASGKPVRIWNISWLSDTTAGVLTMRNGSSSSGTAWITKTGTVSDTFPMNFAKGLHFPAGCYLSLDAHVTSVTVTYENEF